MKLFNPINSNLHHTFDLIRGLAVLLVLFAHLDNFKILILWPFSYQPLQGFIGQIGVELFFLLSGYLILSSATQTLVKPHGILKYTVNRFTRIYPLYLICILFIVVTSDFFLSSIRPRLSIEAVLRHLFFLQGFSPDVSLELNGPFWTLTHEFLFYLLVPILFILKPSRWVYLLSIVISQLFFNSTQGLHAFVNFWRLFAVGILVHINQKILSKFICILLLLVIGILCIEYAGIKVFEFLFAIILFNTLLNFDFKRIIFIPLIGLGIISYSVYVWHAVLIHLFFPYFSNSQMLVLPVKPWLPYDFLY